MHKLYATSALFALAVGAAWAQPPAKTDPPPAFKGPPPAQLEPPKKPADPTDAAIAAALANDADLKMARAKLQLAEAELAKAKQAVTLRVLTLKAQIESLKTERDATLERVRLTEARVRAGQEPQTALAEARITFEKANRALAVAEAEWKLLTGGDERVAQFLYGTQMQNAHDAAQKVARVFELPDLVQTERDHEARVRLLAQLLAQARREKSPVGPVSERIRAALDKPVQIGPKDQAVSVAKALEVFKRDAGLDVSIRGLELTGAAVTSQGETLPVGAWFQLYQDQFGMTAYVRDYGILFSEKKNAPADAVTLLDFWKQKPATPAQKK